MDVVTLGAVLVGVVLSVASYFIFQWATREEEMVEVGDGMPALNGTKHRAVQLNPATLRLFADEKAAKVKAKATVKPKKVAPKAGSKEKVSTSDEPATMGLNRHDHAAVDKASTSSQSQQSNSSEVGVGSVVGHNKPSRAPSSPPVHEDVVVQVARPFNANEGASSSQKEDTTAGKAKVGNKTRSSGGKHSKPAGFSKGKEEEETIDGDSLASVLAPQKWESVGKQKASNSPSTSTSAATPTAKSQQSIPRSTNELSNQQQLVKALEEGGPDTRHCAVLFEMYQAKVKAKESELKKEAQRESSTSERALQGNLNRRLESMEAENTKLRAELHQQSDKYNTFEKTVQQKMADTVQLREENSRLTATLTTNHHKVQQCQQLLREVEILKQELKQKAHSESAEIGETKRLVEKLQAENADLKNAYREAMSTKSQAELNLKKADEAQNAEVKKQVEALNGELDRALAAFNEAKNAHIVQTKERDVLKTEVKKLHGEVALWKRSFKDAETKIEHSSQQLTEMALMVEKLREAETLSQSFRERCVRLEEENQQFEKKLAASTAMLANLEQQQKATVNEETGKQNGGSGSGVEEQQVLLKRNHDLEAEITRLNGELADAKERNHHVESMVKFEKVRDLGATPAAAGSAETSSSGAKLEEHKRRNQTLRDANYKLLEAVQVQEALAKRMVAETEAKAQSSVKELIAATQRSLQKALPAKNKLPMLNIWPVDVDNYGRWVEEALKQGLGASGAQLSNNQPSSKAPSTSSNIELEKQLQNYKLALGNVNHQLAIVQTAAEELERDYSQRVAQLEKQLLAR